MISRFGIALCSFVAAIVPVLAEPPSLPEATLPAGLTPYVDTEKLLETVKSVSELLRTGQLTRYHGASGYYHDAEFPKRTWDDARLKSVVSERSHCDDDVGAMAVHRGWAWMAIAYNVFARTIEGRGIDGPKLAENTRSNQSIDLEIARPGRTALLRVLGVTTLAQVMQHVLDESKLRLATRADVAAFLKTLLAFKDHHDRLVSQGDSIRAWMNSASNQRARDLVKRINSLVPSGTDPVNACLEGYVEHVVTLPGDRQFESGSIYSGGIAMYSVGFWWRREGEGTSGMARVALMHVLERLER